MPKRSAEEKINSLKRKLLKLENKRVETLRALETPARDIHIENEALFEPPREENENEPPDYNETEDNGDKGDLDSPPADDSTATDNGATETHFDEPEQLDPDLLTALGEAVDDDPKFGPKIHANLAERWTPLLRKGLPKETKDKLVKEYTVPENCPLLLAPKLNAEISAAITDLARNRDKKMENSQQRLGLGITALNRGLTTLLTGGDKLSAIQHMSNSCRILGDLHFRETQARTKMITTGLAKSFLTVIQDNERDETLFGEKLSEKIKASKAIEKQGLQIKKPTAKATTATAPAQPRTSNQYQGNWQSPARYPSNRGGRGGRGRGSSATSRKNNWNSPQQPHSKPAGHSKQRGATAAPQ